MASFVGTCFSEEMSPVPFLWELCCPVHGLLESALPTPNGGWEAEGGQKKGGWPQLTRQQGISAGKLLGKELDPLPSEIHVRAYS